MQVSPHGIPLLQYLQHDRLGAGEAAALALLRSGAYVRRLRRAGDCSLDLSRASSLAAFAAALVACFIDRLSASIDGSSTICAAGTPDDDLTETQIPVAHRGSPL